MYNTKKVERIGFNRKLSENGDNVPSNVAFKNTDENEERRYVNMLQTVPVQDYTNHIEQKFEHQYFMITALMNYCLSIEDRFAYGYPIEIVNKPGCAMVFRAPFPDHNLILPAEEIDFENCRKYPLSVPLDMIHSPIKKVLRKAKYNQRNCLRCNQSFLVDKNNIIVHKEECVSHPGRRVVNFWDCCNKTSEVSGCSVFEQHVWSGVNNGINAPLPNFVKTKKPRASKQKNQYEVYALDCEMCFTKDGLELTLVTVVDINGNIVYNAYVRPDNEIIDYNTRFSGVTADHLNGMNVKHLRLVQQELLGIISADTIVVGHGLENDLRALKLIHGRVVDTAFMFPHRKGFPFRQSLKTLSKRILKINIQEGTCGHSPYEDAWASMRLAISKVKYEFRTQSQQQNNIFQRY